VSHTYRVFDKLRDDEFGKWKKRLARNGQVGESRRTHRHKGVRTDGVLVTHDGISETSYRRQLKRETTRKRRRVVKKEVSLWQQRDE